MGLRNQALASGERSSRTCRHVRFRAGAPRLEVLPGLGEDRRSRVGCEEDGRFPSDCVTLDTADASRPQRRGGRDPATPSGGGSLAGACRRRHGNAPIDFPESLLSPVGMRNHR